MARLLRFSIDAMLDAHTPASRTKRGPASRFELQIHALSRLPKPKQKLIADMLDAVLAKENSS